MSTDVTGKLTRLALTTIDACPCAAGSIELTITSICTATQQWLSSCKCGGTVVHRNTTPPLQSCSKKRGCVHAQWGLLEPFLHPSPCV